MDLQTLKARLALAPAPRRVALKLASTDTVRLEDGHLLKIERLGDGQPVATKYPIADVVFGVDENSVSGGVITLSVYANGKFKVVSSSCVPTVEGIEYLEAYGRALAFIREYGLQSKK